VIDVFVCGDTETELDLFFHRNVQYTAHAAFHNNVHEIMIKSRLNERFERLGHVYLLH